MNGQTVVVLPVTGDGIQHSNQDATDIASTVQRALYERTHPEPEHPGPFKQILDHPDSLYKYINWEDPIRTLSVYIGALSILFGAHYLPLTQVALKAGVTTLGVVSVTELASRTFSANSLSARLRPKEYKKIPESMLNATLKDIHDLTQYTVVQIQRIVFGQDLDKTFAAFLGFTALYWLTKMISPFWLAVMGVTSIFVAPLVSSPRGREAAHDASVRAQELANAATEKGRVLAQNGIDKATELSSKGKQTAAELSSQARGATFGTSETATGNNRKLPQAGTNAINETPDTVNSAFGDAKRHISTPTSNMYGDSDGNQFVTSGAADKVSHLSNSASETAKHMAPEVNAGRRSDSVHLQDTVSSLPTWTGGENTGLIADTDFKYAAAGNAAGRYGIINQPYGAT